MGKGDKDMTSLKNFPKFPMAQLLEANIPTEVLQYLLDANKWKEDFEKQLTEMLETYEKEAQWGKLLTDFSPEERESVVFSRACWHRIREVLGEIES